MQTSRRLGVFCGARPGRSPAYARLAASIGQQLGARGIGLVYGGAAHGLMGAVANAVLQHGGEAIGVIPQGPRGVELAHGGLTALHVVPTMHARKAMMARLAHGFVAIPGGFGTLDEFFEIATWRQLGLHHKPVGLLNHAGYYDKLLDFLRHACDEGFAHSVQLESVLVGSELPDLIDQFGW